MSNLDDIKDQVPQDVYDAAQTKIEQVVETMKTLNPNLTDEEIEASKDVILQLLLMTEEERRDVMLNLGVDPDE